jgi:hypothetical protein
VTNLDKRDFLSKSPFQRVLNHSNELFARSVRRLGVLDKIRTLDLISEGYVSFSRFGEGEFRLLLELDDTVYEESSSEKAARLWQVLTDHRAKVVVGVNASLCASLNIHSISQFTFGNKSPDSFISIHQKDDIEVFHRRRLIVEQRNYIRSLSRISSSQQFGDSSCFTVGLYVEEFKKGTLHQVRDALLRIFRGKAITLVSNSDSAAYFFQLTELLSCRVRKHINIPERNAYSRINEVADSIISVSKTSDLVILQAGATGTILASELSEVSECPLLDIGLFRIPQEFLLSFP